jgi:hypothetical protein
MHADSEMSAHKQVDLSSIIINGDDTRDARDSTRRARAPPHEEPTDARAPLAHTRTRTSAAASAASHRLRRLHRSFHISCVVCLLLMCASSPVCAAGEEERATSHRLQTSSAPLTSGEISISQQIASMHVHAASSPSPMPRADSASRAPSLIGARTQRRAHATPNDADDSRISSDIKKMSSNSTCESIQAHRSHALHHRLGIDPPAALAASIGGAAIRGLTHVHAVADSSSKDSSVELSTILSDMKFFFSGMYDRVMRALECEWRLIYRSGPSQLPTVEARLTRPMRLMKLHRKMDMYKHMQQLADVIEAYRTRSAEVRREENRSSSAPPSPPAAAISTTRPLQSRLLAYTRNNIIILPLVIVFLVFFICVVSIYEKEADRRALILLARAPQQIVLAAALHPAAFETQPRLIIHRPQISQPLQLHVTLVQPALPPSQTMPHPDATIAETHLTGDPSHPSSERVGSK